MQIIRFKWLVMPLAAIVGRPRLYVYALEAAPR